ncbi:MAG: hypothetical protein U5R06_17650 [candidate division KSB1 bacterium]|nr:hypothetical protein [candidate division KSB1 bacterium]
MINTIDLTPTVAAAAGFLHLEIPKGEDDLNLGYAVTTIANARHLKSGLQICAILITFLNYE